VKGDSNETSPPSISASGCGRCRALGGLADCEGASLSVPANYDCRAVACWRALGFTRAHGRRTLPIVFRSTGCHRECAWREWKHWRRSGRRAAPDGYTLVIGLWNTHVVNGAIYTLPYDVQKDFEPVALLSNSFSLVVARKNLPADDLKGLIDWLKANPDRPRTSKVSDHAIRKITRSASGSNRILLA
jgi:hypothetical protein